MARKVTTEEFIAKARAAHGDRYDYSQTVYKAAKATVVIICREHGEFLQTPTSHVSQKNGCPECGGSKKLDTASFIAKANAVHGDRYDYSKAKYVNSKTKVEIVCTEHGSFFTSPNNHVRGGSGCPRCSGRGKTNEEFAQEARGVHADRYDYGKVEYVHSTKKVTVTCREHGDFEQIAYLHLSGTGCPTCGGSAPLTAETFIAKAMQAHGEKYDYSRVRYVNNYQKVTIVCVEHGAFDQSPNKHMAGQGCPTCSFRQLGDTRRVSVDEFLARAKEVHGDTYDYSQIDYTDASTRIAIRCREHGAFMQQPTSHLSGAGCAKCAGVAKKTTEEFIAEARAIHGNRYDYSRTDYDGALNNLTVVCSEHGPFEQIAVSHLRGRGCPACATTGFDPDKPGLVYYLRISRKGQEPLYKIGITNRSVEERFPYPATQVRY